MEGRAPIVGFTLRVLDSLEPEIVATVCASEMVTTFGARAAEVIDREGGVWASAGRHDSEMTCWSFPLDRVYGLALKVWIEPTPDAAAWRQQYLDLVSVVRRALKHGQVATAHKDASERDELTGTLNRRGMLKHAEGRIERCLVQGSTLTAMFVDLDHFKQVNDRRGHAVGDEVLRTMGQLIREQVRPTDLVCRWGGDEFLILLRGIHAAGAAVVSDRIRAASQPLMDEYGIGLSIGVVDSNHFPPEHLTFQAMVQVADERLYESKRSGRNRTIIA